MVVRWRAAPFGAPPPAVNDGESDGMAQQGEERSAGATGGRAGGTILLIGGSLRSASGALPADSLPGYRLRWIDGAPPTTEDPGTGEALLAIVDGAAPGAADWLEHLQRWAPDLDRVLAVDPAAMASAYPAWGALADDFLPTPLSPPLLAMALQRASSRREDRGGAESAISGAAEQIDTERLVTARQIVEKIAQLMTRLVKDVQGGIRYFNEMPTFFAIHSRSGEVLAANPIYTELLGGKIGSRSWEIYSGKRARWEHCPVGKTVRSGSVMSLPAAVRYRSGARVPVIVHTAPIYSNEGELELVLEVFAGTKEIERLAAEIKTTQQRFEQLFDAVPSYIAVLDRRLRITAANRRFREAFGDLVGQRFCDALADETHGRRDSPIWQTLKDGQPHQAEMTLTTAAGKPYDLIAWTAPMFTPAGKLLQIMIILMDITELRSLQDNLSTLGMMMGVVSHNLKGSLTGLDAAFYLIDAGFYRNQAAKIEEGLEVGKLVTDRVRKLVRDILYYAKDRELELEAVDAGRFAAELLGGISRRIRGADVTLRSAIPPHAGAFEIDPTRLRSALVNILENALDACLAEPSSRRHEIAFEVRAERNYVLFTISDTGIGMGAEQLQRMLTPFYSTKGKRGTGLGMFIASQVIQKHGGQLKVASDPGKGTCFEIFIPRRIAGVAR
jgi:PAS domain S-box-containing protein